MSTVLILALTGVTLSQLVAWALRSTIGVVGDALTNKLILIVLTSVGIPLLEPWQQWYLVVPAIGAALLLEKIEFYLITQTDLAKIQINQRH